MKKKIIKQIDSSDVIGVLARGQNVFGFNTKTETATHAIHLLLYLTSITNCGESLVYFTVEEVEEDD